MSEDSCNWQDNLQSDTGSFVKCGSHNREASPESVEFEVEVTVGPLHTNCLCGQGIKPTHEADTFSDQSTLGSITVMYAQNVAEIFLNSLWITSKYAMQYVGNLIMKILHYIHQPLTIFGAFYIVTFLIGLISHRLLQGLSPACAIPGIYSSSICQSWRLSESSSPDKPTKETLPDYTTESKSLEHVLRELAAGSRLALHVKKAEMEISELMAGVCLSDISARNC